MKFCKNCGKALNDDARVCDACGTIMGSPQHRILLKIRGSRSSRISVPSASFRF